MYTTYRIVKKDLLTILKFRFDQRVASDDVTFFCNPFCSFYRTLLLKEDSIFQLGGQLEKYID